MLVCGWAQVQQEMLQEALALRGLQCFLEEQSHCEDRAVRAEDQAAGAWVKVLLSSLRSL